MKKISLLLWLLFSNFFLIGQNEIENGLPVGLTDRESELLEWYDFISPNNRFGITSPPEGDARTMAEWEEIQALSISWTQYKSTLAEIVRHAKKEVEVIVICSNENIAANELTNTYNLEDLDNVTFIEGDYNSIWMRDYGPNTIYRNGVDDLSIVEWIYNRPRPMDDLIPDLIGDYLDVPVYSTTEAPSDLVHTGGNFNADGLGTAFSSKLIMDENGPNNQFGVSVKNETQIDAVMQEWMGIDRYIKMETLPYDIIHHIDMHMKLLDEETILIGEYPEGISDGPQIEENLEYVLDNFNSPFGTPYKIIRIPMPPKFGLYPNQGGDYRTYTNSVFVNKTVLVPIYEEQYDTTALRIYEEALPGYNIIGIDCNQIILSSGALHCITKAIGVEDPLLIIHQEIDDSHNSPEDHLIEASIEHRSGIINAILYWKLENESEYNEVNMSLSDAIPNTWAAQIPNQSGQGKIHYYIEASSVSGKIQRRPLVAPEGNFDFETTISVANNNVSLEQPYIHVSPNPVGSRNNIQINWNGSIKLDELLVFNIINLQGKSIKTIKLEPSSLEQISINLDEIPTGVYYITGQSGSFYGIEKIVVQ